MSAGTEALSTNMELTGASLWQAQMLKSIAQMEAYANVTDKAAQAQTKLEAAAHRAAVIQSQNAQKAHADATRQSQLEAKLKHDREQAAAEQEKQQKQMAQAQQGIGIGTSLLNGGGASSAIGMGLAMIPDIGPILAAGFDLGMAGVNAFGRVAGGVFDFVIGMAKEAAQVVGHVAHDGVNLSILDKLKNLFHFTKT